MPLYLMKVILIYAPRRVEFPHHGVVVESMPRSEGKSPVSLAMMKFLGCWARVLPWKEVAGRFGSSWDSVCRSVEWMVEWGLRKRQLDGIQAIGIDEIHWGRGKKGDNFLTVIYQIDKECRRLLWVGKRRTRATLREGFESLGKPVMEGLKYVCSDMWKPYLAEIRLNAGQSLNILDRYHITMHLNKALDEVRRAESHQLRGKPLGEKIKEMRWNLLKSGTRVQGRARKNSKACWPANCKPLEPGFSRNVSCNSGNTTRHTGRVDFLTTGALWSCEAASNLSNVSLACCALTTNCF